MDDLIFDRKQIDLIFKTAKAFWQLSDYSRVKSWIEYLGTRFSITLENLPSKNLGDILTNDNKNTIINNISTLRNSGHYVSPDTPSLPINLLHYTQANDIERILFDLNKWQDSIDNSKRYSGTFYSGESFSF